MKSGTTARPNVTASTVRAPARSNALAASASVAPVVKGPLYCGFRIADCGFVFPAVNPQSAIANPQFEGSRHVRQPRLGCQRRLRGGIARADQQLDHGAVPAAAQGPRQPLALVVAPVPQAPRAEGDGDEPGPGAAGRVEHRDRGGEVVRDAREPGVLERMNRRARARVEPHGRSRTYEGRGPVGAHPAAAEQRLGLAAARAPRGPDRAPAVAADVAHQPGGVAEGQERAAQETFGRQEELLDRLTHSARG